jgi:hypothetical protein
MSNVTVRSTVRSPSFLAASSPFTNRRFKQTWSESFGTGKGAIKNRFTEQVSVRGGKEVIKDKWTTKASSPVLASLPLQLQMNQLESLLPYYQPWNIYRPWRTWYPYQPLALAAPGNKSTLQSTMSWAGGSEKTNIVNKYDDAGRLVGVQVRVKDSPKGNAAVLSPLAPQAQLNLLEIAANPGLYPYATLNPIAWGAPYYYYPSNWRALERVAALEGLPIW